MKFLRKHVVAIACVPLVSALIVFIFLSFPMSEFPDVHIAKAEPETSATLLFVGDIMLDRYIRRSLENHGSLHVLGGVRELIESVDIAAGNLEGPITDSASVSSGTAVGSLNNMRFTFEPTTASMLSSFGFDVLSIGNNHMRDFGTTGVESTKRHLSRAGISYIGDPNGTSEELLIKEVNGIRISYVAYNEFLGWTLEQTLQGVRESKRQNVDLIVVMAHWGDEYVVEPPERVLAVTQKLQEAGADLVMGSHPHIIGTREDRGDMRVYYSLGNFVFDQYWNADVRCGLAVTVRVVKKGAEVSRIYEETKIGMTQDGRTVLGCS